MFVDKIMKNYNQIWLTTISIIFSTLLLSACESDDSLSPPIGNLIGTWYAHEIADETGCDISGNPTFTTYDYLAVIISQSNNSVTVGVTSDTTIVDYVGIFNGTVDGNLLTWSGSYTVDGNTTQSSVRLTVDASCDSMTGTASWTWTPSAYPNYSCSGTSVITVERAVSSGCGI